MSPQEQPDPSLASRWQSWVERTLGGSPEQVDAGTAAAVGVVTSNGGQSAAIKAATEAWRRAAEPAATPRKYDSLPVPSRRTANTRSEATMPEPSMYVWFSRAEKEANKKLASYGYGLEDYALLAIAEALHRLAAAIEALGADRGPRGSSY